MSVIDFISKFFSKKAPQPALGVTYSNPKGWLVQIRTFEADIERIRWWIVARPDWSQAQEIATQAQGLGASGTAADVRVITIRVRREALKAELEGLADGTARLVQ